MKLEKIKRDFIRHMEEVHGGNPYPRNLFGCLMAMAIESEPVSQERIMELTGYNQATVSLTVQKIQLLFSLRTVKKKGDRRHYYVYDDAPNTFVLDLLQRRVDVQDVDLKLIDTLLDKIGRKSDRKELTLFENYLENMKLYHNLIHESRSASVEPFTQALTSGSLEGLDLEDASVLMSGELADFIIALKDATSITNNGHIITDRTHNYVSLKNEYFTGIKTNLNPLFSQAIANRFIVVHSVLLEGRTTQDQIEQTTLLPRSTISEVLVQVVERGIIEVSGTRPKYYRPVVSFSELMLASFDRVAYYMSSLRKQLSEFISLTKKTRVKTNEAKEFLEFLKGLEKGYSLGHAFSVNMKVQTVRKLKEASDTGFKFI